MKNAFTYTAVSEISSAGLLVNLRCFIQKEKPFLWVAYCVDLSLAVQSERPDEAQEKLDLMIFEYLEMVDVLHRTGETETVTVFLSRKSPFSVRLRYHCIRLLERMNREFTRIASL